MKDIEISIDTSLIAEPTDGETTEGFVRDIEPTATFKITGHVVEVRHRIPGLLDNNSRRMKLTPMAQTN